MYPGDCWDPPYALTPESALSPLTTPAQSRGPLPPTATPGSSLLFPTPSSTGDPAASVVAILTQKWPTQDSSTIHFPLPSSSTQDLPSRLGKQSSNVKTTVAASQMTVSAVSTELNPDPSSTPPTPVVIIKGETISLDSPAVTVDGNLVFYSAGSVYIGTKVVAIPTSIVQQGQSPSLVVLSGLSVSVFFSPAPTATVSPPQSLSAGVKSAGTMRGTEISRILPTSPVILPSGALLTIGDETFTPNPIAITIGSQVLSLSGSAITVFNTPLSLGPDGLVVGMTETVQFDPTLVFTVNSAVFTAAPMGYDIDGHTLVPGSAVEIASDVMASLGPSGTDIVLIGSSRTTTIQLAPTTVIGLGGLIMTGFGPIGQPPPAMKTVTASATGPNGSIIYFYGTGTRSTSMHFLLHSRPLPLILYACLVSLATW